MRVYGLASSVLGMVAAVASCSPQRIAARDRFVDYSSLKRGRGVITKKIATEPYFRNQSLVVTILAPRRGLLSDTVDMVA